MTTTWEEMERLLEVIAVKPDDATLERAELKTLSDRIFAAVPGRNLEFMGAVLEIAVEWDEFAIRNNQLLAALEHLLHCYCEIVPEYEEEVIRARAAIAEARSHEISR